MINGRAAPARHCLETVLTGLPNATEVDDDLRTEFQVASPGASSAESKVAETHQMLPSTSASGGVSWSAVAACSGS